MFSFTKVREKEREGEKNTCWSSCWQFQLHDDDFENTIQGKLVVLTTIIIIINNIMLIWIIKHIESSENSASAHSKTVEKKKKKNCNVEKKASERVKTKLSSKRTGLHLETTPWLVAIETWFAHTTILNNNRRRRRRQTNQ